MDDREVSVQVNVKTTEDAKIFVKLPAGRGIPAAIRQFAQALVAEFRKDKSWFDKALIHADGTTRVWVVQEAPGEVKHVVSAELHPLRDWNEQTVAGAVRQLRVELEKLAKGEGPNEAAHRD